MSSTNSIRFARTTSSFMTSTLPDRRREGAQERSSRLSWGFIGDSSPTATVEGARRWAIGACTTGACTTKTHSTAGFLHTGSKTSLEPFAPDLAAAKLLTRRRCMGVPLLHGGSKTRGSRTRCCRSPRCRGQSKTSPTPAHVLRSQANLAALEDDIRSAQETLSRLPMPGSDRHGMFGRKRGAEAS